MNIQEIIINTISSTFAVGLVTYFIQKRIDTKLNKIAEFQKTLLTIKKDRYDTLLKTLQEIWEKLIEIEYYIKWDLEDQLKVSIQKNQNHLEFDSTPLKNALIFIEKRNILLDETLSNMTREFFEKHLLKAYNGYIAKVNEAINNTKTIENNFILDSFGKKYKEDFDALRKEFEKQSRGILYEK